MHLSSTARSLKKVTFFAPASRKDHHWQKKWVVNRATYVGPFPNWPMQLPLDARRFHGQQTAFLYCCEMTLSLEFANWIHESIEQLYTVVAADYDSTISNGSKVIMVWWAKSLNVHLCLDSKLKNCFGSTATKKKKKRAKTLGPVFMVTLTYADNLFEITYSSGSNCAWVMISN